MKSVYPLSFVILCLTAASPALGQGTVIFNNSDSGLVKQDCGCGTGPIPVPAGGGKVQLFWAPTGTAYVPWSSSMSGAAWVAANPGWTLTPIVTMSGPGRFDGGTLTLSPLSPGWIIDYVVLGWTGTAAWFDSALAQSAVVGVSSKLTSRTGNPTADPPGAPVPLANTFTGLLLTIPEPSTFSLVTLGAVFILARSRQARRNL